MPSCSPPSREATRAIPARSTVPSSSPRRVDYAGLKVGVLVPASRVGGPAPENPVTRLLKAKGAHLLPIAFSQPPAGTTDLLDAESAAYFDGLTRHPEEIAKLKNSLWPDIFRSARFLSAVDYLNAQRARTRLMRAFEKEFGDFDFFVCGGGGYTLASVNLTGHPQIVIPQTDGSSVCLVGRLYREDVLCAVAWELQQAIGAHKLRPKLTA